VGLASNRLDRPRVREMTLLDGRTNSFCPDSSLTHHLSSSRPELLFGPAPGARGSKNYATIGTCEFDAELDGCSRGESGVLPLREKFSAVQLAVVSTLFSSRTMGHSPAGVSSTRVGVRSISFLSASPHPQILTVRILALFRVVFSHTRLDICWCRRLRLVLRQVCRFTGFFLYSTGGNPLPDPESAFVPLSLRGRARISCGHVSIERKWRGVCPFCPAQGLEKSKCRMCWNTRRVFEIFFTRSMRAVPRPDPRLWAVSSVGVVVDSRRIWRLTIAWGSRFPALRDVSCAVF